MLVLRKLRDHSSCANASYISMFATAKLEELKILSNIGKVTNDVRSLIKPSLKYSVSLIVSNEMRNLLCEYPMTSVHCRINRQQSQSKAL